MKFDSHFSSYAGDDKFNAHRAEEREDQRVRLTGLFIPEFPPRKGAFLSLELLCHLPPLGPRWCPHLDQLA